MAYMTDYKGLQKDNLYFVKDKENSLAKREFFLAQKAERLTSVLYKITDFLNDNEPMKWRLREEGLGFLLASASFVEENTMSFKDVQGLLYKTRKIISLLRVSFSGSLVSQMNFEVLRDEYSNFEELLFAYKEARSQPQEEALFQRKNEEDFTRYKGQFIKDIKNQTFVHVLKGIKGADSIGNRKRRSFLKQGKKVLYDSETRSERRSAIINFVKDRKEVGIKDILSLPEFTGRVSEKTIQRELADLVLEGVFTKKGERRWSRYSLAVQGGMV